MGWLSNMLGTNSINQDFNYTPSSANYSPNNYLTQSINNLNANAGYQTRTGQDLMSGSGNIIDSWKQGLQEQFNSATDTKKMAMNRQLAARGMGSGGLASLVNAGMDTSMGEQLSKGYSNIMNNAFSMGSNMINASNQAYSTAGNLSQSIDQNALQASMFNAQSANAAQEYARTSEYNQQAANRATRGAFMGNVLGAAGGIAGAFASGGTSLLPQLLGGGSNTTNPGGNSIGVRMPNFVSSNYGYGSGY